MATVINGRGQWGILPKPTDFISTWKTDNTGVSTSTQIKLPLVSTGTYNFVVDWGDGTTSTITAWNAATTTHTYATAGTYTVKIKGICTGWQFNTGGDRLKILSVSSWGKLKLGTTEGGYFYGCSNLNLSGVTDVLDLAGTTNLANCFFNCTSLTTIGRLNEWDVSSVTSMSWMFRGTNLFNQNIGSWNTSSVTTMFGMFRDALKFNNGLALGVAGTLSWNTGAVTNMSEMFSGAIAFNCNVGSWNVSLVSNFNGMFQAEKFNNGGSSDINNWTLKTTGTVNMVGMFQTATIFNQPLNGWNTVAVTTMQYMFYLASAFNNGLASGVAGTLAWNTTSLTNALGTFLNASSFNCNVGSWNVSNVTTFDAMFQSATKFNNGLAVGVAGTLAWNTSSATSMGGMFNWATSFNCNIGNWDVSKVTTFASMFTSAVKFNNGGSSDISNWILKTTGTVNMSSMFNSSTIFNQPLNGWNTIAVNNMDNMFASTAFNNGLVSGVAGTLNWNQVAVTTMYNMFGNAKSFNQNIGSWTVSACTTFDSMFDGASKFNNGGSNSIGNWTLKNTGAITMSSMFASATDFDQNLGSWNVSKVTNFSNFMNTKTPSTFSTTNLDAIYNGWSSRPVLASKSITFGTAKRTVASTAGRAILTNSPNLWTITDGGI